MTKITLPDVDVLINLLDDGSYEVVENVYGRLYEYVMTEEEIKMFFLIKKH